MCPSFPLPHKKEAAPLTHEYSYKWDLRISTLTSDLQNAVHSTDFSK